MLQQANRQMGQAGLLSIQEPTSEITPSLAALDDAQTLRRIEWKEVNQVEICLDNTPL